MDAATNPTCEEVEKELKPESKVAEPFQISPPKEIVKFPEPEEVAVPVASSAESGAKVEETKTEPIVTENIKGIDTDENPKAGESVVVVEESEQKNGSKQGEVPPGEEGKKIEEASGNDNAEVEKVPHPEPDVNSLSKESVVENIEGEPEEKLDTRTVEKQEESKAEPPVENKLSEPGKVVEVSDQLPTKGAAREYIGDIEVLPNEEMEESEAEVAKVEKAEKKKDELEKVINAGEQASIGVEPEDKLDTEIVEKQKESKIVPSVEEKLCEPEKIIEVLKPLPAREFIGNIEVSPDEEMEESEGDLAKVEKPDGDKDELEKIINDGEKSSIKGEPEVKIEAEAVEKQEGSKVEPSVEEKLGEQEATGAAREYIGNVEVLPDEEMEEPEVGLAKVENIEEKKDETEKIFNPGEQSSIEAIVENVDKNPGEQVEPIEVQGADVKPEEISETQPAEKLEQSTVELVEEKPRELGETVQVQVQLSLDPVEGKVESLEELPVKEVEGSVEKKGTVSEAEPAEKQEEFKVEPICEKVDEPTETLPAKVEETAVKEVDDPETEVKPEEIYESKNVESVETVPLEPVKVFDNLEQSSVKEKVEELPLKEAEEYMEKKVIIPESEGKHEEILDAEPSQIPDEPKDELPEKKLDEPTEIVEAVEEGDKCIEKVEELPASIVEEIHEAKDKEAHVSEVESKPAEISETKPIESVEEKSVEPENIVDVPLQASVLEKPGEAEELTAKEIDIKDEEPEGIPETKPADKLEGSEVASVEAKPEPIKIADVQEQSSPEIDKDKTEVGVELPTKEVEAISEKENEVPEAEFKHDEISETEPAEKQDESKHQLVAESLSEPTKIVDVPEESVKQVVEEKVGSKEEFPAKEVDAPAEDTVKVSEHENKPQEINETKPVETIEELVEPEKIVDASVEEKSEKVEGLPAKEREAAVETEAKVLDSGFKPEEIPASTPEEKLAEQSEVTEQHDKELPAAVPSEKEPKVLVSEIKPEEISKSTPEEKLIEQCEVTDQSDKEPPAAEPVEKEAKSFEAEPNTEEISESTPKEIPVKQSETIEQSEKEAPASEPVEDLAEKVDKTDVSNKAGPAIHETEEVSAKTDTPNEQKDSVKKSEEVDLLPEEKVADSGKTELVTEPQEGKSVATREFTPCEEAKPTESETTEKIENGNTKNEAAVEENRDEETTKEAETCEPETQTENIGRSLKDKLDQEKRDDETTKTDVQTEANNESEDTKVPEDASKEEVPAKTTQKQSHNIMKMVKHSLVKAKKAIIGKSSNSKAPASEINAEEVSK